MEEEEQADTVPDTASQTCVNGDTGANRVVPEHMCICEGKGEPEERENTKPCCPQGEVEEGRKRAEDSKALSVEMYCVPEDREAVQRQRKPGLPAQESS